jgi:hypothetical protein
VELNLYPIKSIALLAVVFDGDYWNWSYAGFGGGEFWMNRNRVVDGFKFCFATC